MSVLSVSRLISLSIRITDAPDDDKYFSYLGCDKKEMLFLFASSTNFFRVVRFSELLLI